ncbi:MAG: hypothetical protein V3V05_10830 [Pontiella sp.]
MKTKNASSDGHSFQTIDDNKQTCEIEISITEGTAMPNAGSKTTKYLASPAVTSK